MKELVSVGRLAIVLREERAQDSEPAAHNGAQPGQNTQGALQCLTTEYMRLNQMWVQYLHSQHLLLNILIVGTGSIGAAWIGSQIRDQLAKPLATLVAVAYPIIAMLFFSHGRMMKLIRGRMFKIGEEASSLLGRKAFDWDDGDSDWLNRVAFDVALVSIFVVPASVALVLVGRDLRPIVGAVGYAGLAGIVLSGALILYCLYHYGRRYTLMIVELVGRRSSASPRRPPP